ncbi:ParB N-terminal domain-containing protein [Georgenia sp. MJ206]|uniref:ParB/RepB/Spo0J family partition protein n=1 Tax=Georgenia wangjunii TaxID=3117730 RepID=UPI002F268BEC
MATTTPTDLGEARAKRSSKRTAVPATEKAASAAGAVEALTAGPDLHARRVDPRDLTIDANVRTAVDLDRGFVDSIREHGVLTPVLVRATTLGELLVVDGQRRTLAAIEAGRPDVPFTLVDGIGDDEARIVTQIVSNDRRADLTAAERIAGYQQLSLLGRSPASIARKVGTTTDRVEQALTVAGTPRALAAAAEPGLTLDHLAVIAEFDDDPDVVERLTRTALDEPGQFAHMAQINRDQRAERAAIAVKTAELEAAGVTVLPQRPSWEDKTTETLNGLSDKPGGRALDAVEHAESCPGHAVHVFMAWGNRNERKPFVDAYCVGWREHGHVNRHAQSSSGATSGPQSEDQKAERRTLIERNKAALAAEKVRRAWVADLLKRDKLPADAPNLAAMLFILSYAQNYGEQEIRDELLGIKPGTGKGGHVEFVARPAKASAYLLAWAIARAEAGMPKDFWRNPASGVKAYLEGIAAWGYDLADVERLVTDGEPV